MEMFDAIVAGVGTMGSATCSALAERGARVLGLERFGIPHARGAHHAESRVFRVAYYEHPDYVPLLVEARSRWIEADAQADGGVFTTTGLFFAGHPGGEALSATIESARVHGLDIDLLDEAERRARFPQCVVPAGFSAIFEPAAGVIVPEAAVVHFARLAPLIRVTRQVVAWFEPREPGACRPGELPCFAFEDEGGAILYGFPELRAGAGVKAAIHRAGEACDPEAPLRAPDAADEREIRVRLERFVPAAAGPVRALATCTYANSPDAHFIIDRVPGSEGVLAACGFSGHGFKFAPVMGAALADLALEGTTRLAIGFLSLGRLGVR